MSRHYGKWSGELEEEAPDFQEQEKMKIKTSISGYILCITYYLLGFGWHLYSPYDEKKVCLICYKEKQESPN